MLELEALSNSDNFTVSTILQWKTVKLPQFINTSSWSGNLLINYWFIINIFLFSATLAELTLNDFRVYTGLVLDVYSLQWWGQKRNQQMESSTQFFSKELMELWKLYNPRKALITSGTTLTLNPGLLSLILNANCL